MLYFHFNHWQLSALKGWCSTLRNGKTLQQAAYIRPHEIGVVKKSGVGEGSRVNMGKLCQTSNPACDRLVDDLRDLNERMRKSVVRAAQYGDSADLHATRLAGWWKSNVT